MWVILAVASSAFLGIYDVFKKLSLRDNAVLPVLFFASFTGALIFAPFVAVSLAFPGFSSGYPWHIPSVGLEAHLFFLLKSVIVGSSWVFAYFAMKHLPITVAAPVRASGPVFALIGAILYFGERLSVQQWIGLTVTFCCYYLFATAGKKEGIVFRNNKWMWFMVIATIIGAASSLYDKFLTARYDRLALQAWFSLYLVPVLAVPLLSFWFPNRKKYTPFRWSWAIPMIGVALIAADFLYFYALSLPGSLIGVISTVRRTSVLTSFTVGSLVFREEKNKKLKGLILIGIVAGIAVIMLGS